MFCFGMRCLGTLKCRSEYSTRPSDRTLACTAADRLCVSQYPSGAKRLAKALRHFTVQSTQQQLGEQALFGIFKHRLSVAR